MGGELQPLAQNFKIVDENGLPTLYFIKWAQQRQIDIQESISLADLQQYLTDHKLQAGLGISLTPDGNLSNSPTIAANIQALLDSITNVRGSILYRGAGAWNALAPGTAGYILATNGAGADPAWIAPPSGGGATIYYSCLDANLVVDPLAGGTVVVSVNIPASGVARNFLVFGELTFSGAHAVDIAISLDGTILTGYPTQRYADGGDRTLNCHAGPQLCVVPGDSAAHVIGVKSADVGSTGVMTYESRSIMAIQVT